MLGTTYQMRNRTVLYDHGLVSRRLLSSVNQGWCCTTPLTPETLTSREKAFLAVYPPLCNWWVNDFFIVCLYREGSKETNDTNFYLVWLYIVPFNLMYSLQPHFHRAVCFWSGSHVAYCRLQLKRNLWWKHGLYSHYILCLITINSVIMLILPKVQ